MISVVVPTTRFGGLDVLFHGLRNQTYRDFELVVSDAVRPWRGLDLRYLGDKFGVRVKHVDASSTFPVQSYCDNANRGLRAAEGDVVILAADYTWFPPNCLARHHAFHVVHPDPSAGYMGPHFNVVHPELHPAFPRYGDRLLDSSLQAYEADVRTGALDAFGWSVFKDPFCDDASRLQLCPWLGRADPKTGMAAGPVDKYMLHLKNESFKASRIREVGGLWTQMDGSVCWQDSELADALGISWTLDPENPAYVVNPRALFPLSRRVRPEGSNEALWKAGRPRPYIPL